MRMELHVHLHIPAAHVLEMVLFHPNPSTKVPPAALRGPWLLCVPGRFIRQGSLALKLHFYPCPTKQGLCVAVPSAQRLAKVPEGTGTFREERTSLRKLSLFSYINFFVHS